MTVYAFYLFRRPGTTYYPEDAKKQHPIVAASLVLLIRRSTGFRDRPVPFLFECRFSRFARPVFSSRKFTELRLEI
jgi:hypothetical protein